MRILLIHVLALVLMVPTLVMAGEPIVIEIGIAEKSEAAGLELLEKVLIPKFEGENPGIKVSMSVIGWGMDTYMTRYVANVAPDAFQMGGDRVGTYVDMITPLDTLARGWSGLSDFPEVLLQGARVKGQLYGIPFAAAIRALLYRTDMFEESGLDARRSPSTWEELAAFGKRLTRFDANGQMIRQGFRLRDHWFDFAPFLYQAGGDYMNPDRTRFTFGSAAGQEAATFMRSLLQEHRVSHPAGELGNLREGQTAMEVDEAGILHLPEYRNVVSVGTPLKHREQVQVAYGDLWAITNTSPHQDAAWKWLTFITRIDNMTAYSQTALVVPARGSVFRYEPWSNDPRFAILYGGTAWSRGLPFDSRHMDQARKDFVQPTMKRILYENAPISDLVEAERQANSYLASKLK